MHKAFLLSVFTLVAAPLIALSCSSSGADSFTGNRDCSISGTGCKVACDPTLGCVECAGNGDCGAASPICVAGHCRQCGSTSDCGTGQACFPGNHTCAPACSGPGTCANQNGAPICDASSGACVGCLTNKDCSGSKPVCDPTSGQCGECASSSDCGAARPICNLAARECVQCLVDGQCPSGGLCADQTCHKACQGNADCGNPALPICRPDGQCGQCAAPSDCPASAPVCTAQGACSQCASNTDCKAPTPLCDGERCVQCIENKDCASGLKCQNRQCVAG